MAQLMPRYNAHSERLSDEQKLAKILLEVGEIPIKIAGATAAGDSRKLRGIPAIGRGVTGAIRDTVPHAVAA